MFSINKKQELISDYDQDFDDLVMGRRAGHMGHHEFTDQSMGLWENFISLHDKDYYIPANEIALIEKSAAISASLLGNTPVTLVSRGCGTRFLAKEGALIRHLKNIVGVVYIDRSESALDQSIKEGKFLLPHAWHKTIKADIYDSDLKYRVEGTEVGTSFGQTFMNIEGTPEGQPPIDSYTKNLAGIYEQMAPSAHFICTYDHNQDAASLERAYAGQTAFAKNMLHESGSLNPDIVDFVVKFHPQSQILSHGFRFKNDSVISSLSGTKKLIKGDTLWFNNSVKPTIQQIRQWNSLCGFDYVRADTPMDAQNRLGWHHFIKPKK